MDKATENLIIYNLLSERYHELRREPDTRDKEKFRQIEDLYRKYKAVV